jgi:two-component sensor histidine kinase
LRRLTWHNSSQSDQQLREYLILALLRSRACVTLQDDSLTYLYIANLPRIWTVRPDETPTDETVFGARVGAEVVTAKKKVLLTGQPEWLEVEAKEGALFEVHVETVPSLDGRHQVLTTIVDITEARRRERVLRDLLLEVSHRSKNLLAVIQGLASQSARYSETLEQFLSEFRGRIFAISSSQDLVTDADWFGVPLRDLAQAQAALQDVARRPEIIFSGLNPVLTPNAALHLGLGFHELMAWLPERARGERPHKVVLSCDLGNGGDRGSLELSWKVLIENRAGETERGQSMRPGGFSRLLLERVVPQSLGGSATFDNAGSSYLLAFPQTDSNIRHGGTADPEATAENSAST